ncbi:MAG: hypothetical protein ACJ8F7_18420 [Gemmataceae bacterium]
MKSLFTLSMLALSVFALTPAASQALGRRHKHCGCETAAPCGGCGGCGSTVSTGCNTCGGGGYATHTRTRSRGYVSAGCTCCGGVATSYPTAPHAMASSMPMPASPMPSGVVPATGTTTPGYSGVIPASGTTPMAPPVVAGAPVPAGAVVGNNCDCGTGYGGYGPSPSRRRIFRR